MHSPKASPSPKARISDIFSALLSFVEAHKDSLPNAAQITQGLRDVQNDLDVLSADALEIAWSSISSELQKSLKKAKHSETTQPVSHHFSQIRSAITEFQKHPPVSFNDKRNSKKMATEILTMLSSVETQSVSSPARAKTTVQTLKTKIGADFVSFFRQSQLDRYQKAKRKEEITKSLDALLATIGAGPKEELVMPPEFHEVADIIASMKPKQRAVTPPSQRNSKIPTRVTSPARDDRRRSDMGAVAHKMKASPRKEPKAMTSILASRKSLTLSLGGPKHRPHGHRRSGSLTEAADELMMVSSKLRRASSSNEIEFDAEKAVPKSPLLDREMDSETDMMMSALSRSGIAESKTHALLEKVVARCEGGGQMLQECLQSIRRVEIKCQRFMANFGENEVVSRFLAKIGEAKMLLSEGKKEEVAALFNSVEKVFESVEVRDLLKNSAGDEQAQDRVRQIRESPKAHAVETFMRNELDRLEQLTKQMKGFTDWREERDQESRIHQDLREKLNSLRQEFASLTDARNSPQKGDPELVAEIKEKHALVQKRREQQKTVADNAAQKAKSWSESEQRLVAHYRLATQQLSKLMAARRKLVAEKLVSVTVRGMEYTLTQLDQAIAQVIERESRVTKGFSKVSSGRRKFLSELSAMK